MPFDCTPRSSAAPIALPLGSFAPDARERRLDAGGDVRRAANDLMLPGAVVDDADGQLVGVRMALDAEHLAPRRCCGRRP